MDNFDIAEDALSVALNSAGSAAQENEKHLESIHGRVSQFKAAWESLSQTIVDNGLVKNIVSFGTTIIGTIEKIIGALNTLDAAMLVVSSATIGLFGKNLD